MKKVNVNVNGEDMVFDENISVLEACKQVGIDIPALCYHPDLDINYGASCRLCIVEIVGKKDLMPSCATKVEEGMIVKTHSKDVIEGRRTILQLLIEEHPLDCLTCEKAGNCKLQDYCYEYDVKGPMSYPSEKLTEDFDTSNEFYDIDNSKCILCGLCVRACTELQVIDAISMVNRSGETKVSPAFGRNISESPCVSCGTCVSLCPVGALSPKKKNKVRHWDVEKRVKTTCPYCGVGCQVYLEIKDNEIVGVEPDYDITNKGLLCVKGKFGYGFVNHKSRLKTPLIRKDGVLTEATWDEAYDLIISKISSIKSEYGNEAFAGLSSAKVTNEENYLFQKMVRGYMGNNNVDHCARLCHASTVAGLAATLGSGAMTNSNLEILDSDVILVTGSNTTESHPVLGSFMKQAQNKGAKLIVADPRVIPLAEKADVYMPLKPGTNVALFNSMMQVIIEENLQDREYIKETTENYEELAELVKDYTPEYAGKICGVKPESIREAARIYASGDRASIFYSMGVTQHTTGTQGVMTLSNLAMLCGNIGKESSGINPLRGQNNVQGACDLGALPGDFTGYQKVYDPKCREKFENAWNVKLTEKAGLTLTEIMSKCHSGDIKLLYIMGENPMISDPDITHVAESLELVDFLVVQDIFLTETAAYADVVLPASTFAEKDGTFTNSERRVQRVRAAIDPVGKSKPDWIILMDIMNKLGMKEKYNSPEDIFNEIAELTPQYAGINYDRIKDQGLQWPCYDINHPGTKFLHQGSPKRGKGLFKPAEYLESAECTDKDYPYILTTGRILYHYHTRTMTGKVEGLNNLFSHSYVEINPTTASRLNISDGEMVKLVSRRGEIKTKAVVTDSIQEDVLFVPFHFADGAVNYLTNPALDPIAKIPELKVSAVRIEKL
jgi:formate dehydrogenase major subunit